MNGPLNEFLMAIGTQAEIVLATYRAVIKRGATRREARDVSMVVLRVFIEKGEERKGKE